MRTPNHLLFIDRVISFNHLFLLGAKHFYTIDLSVIAFVNMHFLRDFDAAFDFLRVIFSYCWNFASKLKTN